MFYFNTKAKAYEKNGVDYNIPFGLYTIISGSMEPNVEVYDVVIAADYDISKIKVGDIITFVSNWDINYGKTVTHRVVAISKSATGEYQLTTKGDNNQSKDGGIVTQNNLIGKVVGRLPQLGQLQVFLATKMGWFMVVFVPALAIIIFDMIKIFKLYVLKSEINNVKTPKEAVKEKTAEELKQKTIPLKETKSNTLNRRNEKNKKQEPVDRTKKLIKKREEDNITEDKNIDTVELPKIDSNGKITENTKEIPLKGIKIDDLPKIDNSNKKIDDIPIPLAKRKIENRNEPVERTQLKRRK